MEVILLRLGRGDMQDQGKISFNPCFYGSYSFTNLALAAKLDIWLSFNPCFYGSYSFTKSN